MISEAQLDSKTGILKNLKAEEISKMKVMLQQQGVRFEPKKRIVDVPLITNQTVDHTFSEKSRESARLAIGILDDYLFGEMITDQWGDDHTARQEWQNEMITSYPGVFEQVYYRHNLLRSSLMTGVIMAIQRIQGALNPEFATTLKPQISTMVYTLLDVARGSETESIPYKDMSLDQKKRVIQIFEDKIVDVYRILTGNNAQTIPLRLV